MASWVPEFLSLWPVPVKEDSRKAWISWSRRSGSGGVTCYVAVIWLRYATNHTTCCSLFWYVHLDTCLLTVLTKCISIPWGWPFWGLKQAAVYSGVNIYSASVGFLRKMVSLVYGYGQYLTMNCVEMCKHLSYGKVKGKVHPRTGHEDPEGE
jgi:hypothetical protein